MNISKGCGFIGLLLLCIAPQQIGAQEGSALVEDGPAIPADDFDRGTPFRSVEGFLAAADKGDFETAAEYLDLRNLRGAVTQFTGAQLARGLDIIAKRATWVSIDEMIDEPAGRGNDNLPPSRDSIGVVLDNGKEVRLLMQRVARDDGVLIWKVSNATVALLPQLYEAYGYPEAIEVVRRNLPNVVLLGFELFVWVIVLGVAALSYALVYLVALAVRRTLGDPGSPSHRQIFRFLTLPLGIWAVVLSMNITVTWLGRGVTAETIGRVTPIPILVTVWLLYAGINLYRDIYAARLRARGRPGAAMLLRPAGNAIKLLIAVGAVLMYLDKLGVDITTVLAGLGVGGIAVALALQKPMEDVFGAITLYSQQPFRVGDFCRIGEYTGTVEEVGLRTTRIRTLANTLVAIPNARVATAPIDNISARQKIWYRPILRLRYDTTPEQLRNTLEGIRTLLGSHERVLQDNHRVRFKEIADDALLVEVYAYINTGDWAESLGVAEDLNIRILEIVAQAGTALSLPARTLHVEQGASAITS